MNLKERYIFKLFINILLMLGNTNIKKILMHMLIHSTRACKM